MSVEAAIVLNKEEYNRKWSYNGGHYTIRELSELPECVVGIKTLSSRVYDGMDIHKSLTMPNQSSMPSRRTVIVTQEETEKLKKIMSVPVNPMKCVYHCGIKEINKMLLAYSGSSSGHLNRLPEARK